MNQCIEVKLEEYKQYLLANKSKNTVKNYVPYVKKFIDALGANDLTEITQVKITEYFAIEKCKYGAERYRILIKAIKGFCAFHKMVGIEFPKFKTAMSTKVKKPITEKELGELIEPSLIRLFPNPLQVKALLYFMFYTGFRKNEIIALPRKAFDLVGGYVTAYATKQSIQRRVALNPNLKLLLSKYFGCEAEVKNAFNMTVDKLNHITIALEEHEVLGKEREVWPHLFRDSFACHCLNQGMSLPELQILMGHTNVQQTMKYLTICQCDLDKRFLEKVKGIQ
jgi:integrase/recombinase XerD